MRRHLILVVRFMKQVSLLLILLLTACTATLGPRPLWDITDSYKKSCEMKNGDIQAITYFSRACFWSSEDAGKSCTDNDQCNGICETGKSLTKVDKVCDDKDCSDVVSWGTELGQRLVGVCSKKQAGFKFQNCQPYVDNGIIVFAPCND